MKIDIPTYYIDFVEKIDNQFLSSINFIISLYDLSFVTK